MKLTKLAAAVTASLALSSLAHNAVAQTDEERITALEQKIAVLQAQQNSSDLLDRFTINGFASVGVGMASEDGSDYAGYDDDEVAFSPDSMAALQMSFAINDNAQAVIQLVGRGDDDWDPEIEWAYISYTFDNDVTVRGGRLRLPVFMLSDYLEVGYAYPFARPSVEVYGNVPVSTYEGFDVQLPFDVADATLTIQPFIGEGEITNDTDFSLLYGSAAELSYGNFSFRASIATGELESEDVIVDEQDGDFLGFGMTWDNGDWLFMSEWTRVEVDGLTPDTDGYYASLAYRYDAFTPYFMYAVAETQDDDERAAVFPPTVRAAADIERTAYSLGLRWDFAPSMAVKFDATLLDDFGSSSGGLGGNNQGGIVVQEYSDMALYSVVFDVIF